MDGLSGDHLTLIRDLFAAIYHVRRDEEVKDWEIPLRGGRGVIYAHGPATLAAHIQSAKPGSTVRAIKRKVPSASVTQIGDFEVILICPVEDAEAFLGACGARTRRVLNAVQRPAATERVLRYGPEHRFKKKHTPSRGNGALEVQEKPDGSFGSGTRPRKIEARNASGRKEVQNRSTDNEPALGSG